MTLYTDDGFHFCKTMTMIESIGIKNYKSIVDLQFDVGRVNVFIGENGSGKSNILEAIALAAAAEADKLDYEFLTSRGIRVTSPFSMRSTFTAELDSPIEIVLKLDGREQKYKLENDNQPYSKWTYNSGYRTVEDLIRARKKQLYQRINDLQIKTEQMPDESQVFSEKLQSILEKELVSLDIQEQTSIIRKPISSMIIYSPEETALRNLYQEGQIEPLGIHGEGLLKLIKVMDSDKSGMAMNTIKDSLRLLGWFEDLNVSIYQADITAEEKVNIFDHFTQSWFDQRSANEGFLFVLFYAALMVSRDTPSIFAIDNVDASLNPKLCSKIIDDIVKLAKQFDKQSFLTAHNPAILDGIDLGDDEQRLFVVSRSRKGHTRVKRIGIDSKPVSSTGEDLKLSEAFLRGYLGGLPKNF